MSSASATAGPSRRHSQFRPCIDLHQGVVKQIVGGTLDLTSVEEKELKTNFVAANPSSYYAKLYRDNGLTGGHVIKLGPNNDDAAKEALRAWPNGLQVGGGITGDNALDWLELGAEKVIVTSYLFPDARLSLERLEALSRKVGKERLVVDISCRRREKGWVVAMNGWKTLTDTYVTRETITLISQHTSELLIHAADVEGLCQGIDEDLVRSLGEWCSIPCTYAGGAKELGDLELVDRLSGGQVDLTFGSALDIFGGKGVGFDELVQVDKRMKEMSRGAV
ncbi:histidine biosynthesis enzyme 1--5-imidazole-4-carboxamide isomerase [Dioszegia hungarica]|uniref:1-(5-phosphoribosyl)-5-[(5-phosphoribosylamino)methylideneamino] imidazole-4-carboxamide isomerase n=1 Tax=Dioszegia hungarica TaxID=4972 RepID=A0AA38HFF3_9TREE|nr:histidine biosynthesis enzyme 1--5-imidazole-4-carboxamide isomerase [Dioszegia hungarica]KAI9638584.1 histidine biosynthesis enzyme 1--5-imidazole-4-carboxamide isomerase [Dioszegia hungarica]